MTKTLAPTRKGPDSVMHALNTSGVDERRTMAPNVIAGLPCYQEKITYETHSIFYRYYVYG
jgi:hypothetical protein